MRGPPREWRPGTPRTSRPLVASQGIGPAFPCEEVGSVAAAQEGAALRQRQPKEYRREPRHSIVPIHPFGLPIGRQKARTATGAPTAGGSPQLTHWKPGTGRDLHLLGPRTCGRDSILVAAQAPREGRVPK